MNSNFIIVVPIFTFTYNQQQTTADGKWLVPDNIVVPGTFVYLLEVI